MKPQPLQPAREDAPQREPTPEEALREAVARVAADARRDPEAFLEQTRVPAGGE